VPHNSFHSAAHAASPRRRVELDHGPVALGAADESAVVVHPRVGTLDDSAVASLDRGGLATLGDPLVQAACGQVVAHRLTVVAAVQVHGAASWQWAERDEGIQGGAEQGVVIAIGGGGYRAQWDSSGVGDHGAFEALLATVDRARAGGLPTTGRLGGAAVHG
jgi:hypothetical protein